MVPLNKYLKEAIVWTGLNLIGTSFFFILKFFVLKPKYIQSMKI